MVWCNFRVKDELLIKNFDRYKFFSNPSEKGDISKISMIFRLNSISPPGSRATTQWIVIGGA
jgi:hypothetical protein